MDPARQPGNRLIDRLDADARAALAAVPVQLRARQVLHEPGAAAVSAYFPETAVISLVSTMQSGASAEVALVGREGMVGLAGVFGSIEGPTTAIVQVPGAALRVSAVALKAARRRFPSVRAALDLYTQARLIQTAQTAACNRLHSVEERLARWLLTVDDRIDTARFTLSQEFMAQMLGVQRPTVSTSLQRFQEGGMVAYEGRSMVVADRAGLQRIACECYGLLRREFDRLLHVVNSPDAGPLLPDQPAAEEQERESPAAVEALREVAGRLLIASIREQEAREDAQAANHVAEGQLSLVEDLLDAARLASVVRTGTPSLIVAEEIVRRAIDAVKPLADEKKVDFALRAREGLPPILADADRLCRVLVNVLSNTLKLADPQRPIDVSIAGVGQPIRIIFCGANATEELRLGFTIARAVVELHGGTIEVAAGAAGQGASWTITLPTSTVTDGGRYSPTRG